MQETRASGTTSSPRRDCNTKRSSGLSMIISSQREVHFFQRNDSRAPSAVMATGVFFGQRKSCVQSHFVHQETTCIVANDNEWFALLGLKLHDTRKDPVHISSVGGRTDFARQRGRWQVGATISLAPHVQLHRFQATNGTPPQASGTLLIDLTWRVVVMGGTYHPRSSQGECKLCKRNMKCRLRDLQER